MTVDDPGFLSRIVRWPWAITPGLQEAKTFHWVDADGDPYDPGTVTAKAGPDGTISATVTGTGATRTITWSSGQTTLIPGSQWRLNFDGHDWVGGRIGTAQPEDAPPTDNDWTIQLPGDGEGDGLTITVAGGGSGSSQLTASVILYAATLSLEAGDPIYRVSYRPGWVDEGERVPNDWSVDEAYEWGDDFTPAEGGTKVLVLLPGELWPSVFALATEGALTPITVAGGTQITVGCGGTDGPADFASAIWIGWNLDGFENSTDPSAPAGLFIPQAIGAKQVRLGSDRTGALADIYDLDQLADALDTGTGMRAAATHRIPMVAGWNPTSLVPGIYAAGRVFLFGCAVADITPAPATPFQVIVEAAFAPGTPSDPSAADIPSEDSWFTVQDLENADIYGALLIPLDYLVAPYEAYLPPEFEGSYPFGQPIWYRGRSIDADGFRTVFNMFMPDGIPADPEAFPMVVFADGHKTTFTIDAPADDTTAGDPSEVTVDYEAIGTGLAPAARNVDARMAALEARVAALEP